MACVLVVGDSGTAKQALVELARGDGHRVEVVSDVRECIERLAGKELTVVALSADGPDGAGLDVLRRIRSDASLNHVPVIVSTSGDEPATIDHCFALGAVDVIVVPANSAENSLRLRAAMRLGQALASEQLALQEAARASLVKAEFLANMSHEIRTPMNGVMGHAEMLMETRLDHTQREHAEGILSASRSLMAIINDILDYAGLEAGRLPAEESEFDLVELLYDVVQSEAEQARSRGIELLLSVPPELPTRFVGDVSRLRQVVFNLVNNAVKFTDEGHVVLSVEQMERDDETLDLRLTVTDTGVGMSEPVQDLVFESFRQADGSSTRRYGGVGLGLAIARRLVELMGGRMGVTSTLGQGSTFWVRLCLRLSQCATEAAAVPASLGGKRVMLADHTPLGLSILSNQLMSWGMRPSSASTGAEALEAMTAAVEQGDPFQLVLVDSQLPDMPGSGLAHAVRSDPRLADLSMVLLTSAPQPDDRFRCEDEGFAGYLVKPVRPEILQSALGLVCDGAPTELVTRRTVDPSVAAGETEDDQELESRPPPVVVGHVLVVEDNTVNQRVAVRMLESLGCRVDVAPDGKIGVALARSNHYDVVLMDCSMPVMDGFEATRRIRRHDEKLERRTPIVAMTAHALAGDRARCLDVGMDGYLTKPLQRRALAETLAHWLSTDTTVAT
jgi:signal transduction histidine kinase